MTTTATTIKMPTTLHFTKTIRETKEYNISYDLDYKRIHEWMTQMDDESQMDFKKRCDEIWEGLCDKKDKNGTIDLGEHEEDGEEDEWDGDPEQECADDICELIDRETQQLHPQVLVWKKDQRKKADERWEAEILRQKEIATLKKRLAELESVSSKC
jgi:hypothetical protein